jgi:hypothetical protein
MSQSYMCDISSPLGGAIALYNYSLQLTSSALLCVHSALCSRCAL